jgi:hypothetical protein
LIVVTPARARLGWAKNVSSARTSQTPFCFSRARFFLASRSGPLAKSVATWRSAGFGGRSYPMAWAQHLSGPTPLPAVIYAPPALSTRLQTSILVPHKLRKQPQCCQGAVTMTRRWQGLRPGPGLNRPGARILRLAV